MSGTSTAGSTVRLVRDLTITLSCSDGGLLTPLPVEQEAITAFIEALLYRRFGQPGFTSSEMSVSIPLHTSLVTSRRKFEERLQLITTLQSIQKLARSSRGRRSSRR